MKKVTSTTPSNTSGSIAKRRTSTPASLTCPLRLAYVVAQARAETLAWPPKPSLSLNERSDITRYNPQKAHAMTHIMHRLLNTPYPVAVAGDGPYLIDAQGKRYIDSASGAGVSCLGHSAHKISEAIARQSKKLAYVYNAYFTT
ncbi:MAG: aminotransferase class III-fold pyridoxal phosphate-dependent enzyme, partial [Alphaproteobacteria bacterium]